MANYFMVFDTETTGLDKPFCYDIGYVIVNQDCNTIEKSCHYIVEQVWHNMPLFESAYYKDKRPIYIKLMRQHKAIMDKYGYIMQAMIRDIQSYKIEHAYAYNSSFDDKVFTFNCDWYKCMNPFDNVAIHDIWGYASQYITNTKDYKEFCELHERFNDSGNYKGSAEVVYQYIHNNPDFIEAHNGIEDSIIECEILQHCFKLGAEPHSDYTVNRILPRIVEKPFTIKVNKNVICEGKYVKKYVKNDVYNFTIL